MWERQDIIPDLQDEGRQERERKELYEKERKEERIEDFDFPTSNFLSDRRPLCFAKIKKQLFYCSI